MAYEYYCMGCGAQLNQELAQYDPDQSPKTVLFDMQYLLTRDTARKFNILKLRMTQKELKELIASGTTVDAGYRACKLTLPQILGCMSDEKNLNNQEIRALTLEQIDEYLKQGMAIKAAAKKKSDDPFNLDEEVVEEAPEAEPEKPYEVPGSILAMESKDTANVDLAFTRANLRSDLEMLQGIFDADGVYEFRIREENEEDNDGRDVLVGVELNLGVGGFQHIHNRICSKCGLPVFEHAGTAPHQSVAFIGYQAAGKTSTILALTHYAANHMITGFGSGIWEGSSTIDSVATVEVLDKSPRLVADLGSYNQGIAPAKTEAQKREDAYCATFRIKNKAQKRHYLFTLTDLPGELCDDETGTVDTDNVKNHFPVATACDAFVACFDTQSISDSQAASTAGGATVVDKVLNVCRWADQFQKLRAAENQVKTYVPTMLLFTKCEDLEDPNAKALTPKKLLPLDEMYMLKDEKRYIARDKKYKFVQEQFGEFGQLNRSYHAMMRCSPFGYKAPSANDIQERGAEYHAPCPKNIDLLMRWLLSVSGCIPTEVSYSMTPTKEPVYWNDYCISRPQLRSQNPADEGYMQEAMARCTLFENPGKFDVAYVGKYGIRESLMFVKLKSRFSPDSNDKE